MQAYHDAYEYACPEVCSNLLVEEYSPDHDAGHRG